jgi:hypothetical protein
MLRRMIMAGVVFAFAAVPMVARAQTNVGGDVPSFLQLSVVQPQGFGSFPKVNQTHTYSLTINALVTTTNSPVLMTITDGDASSGARHGHLISGSSVLPSPLEVATGTGAASWRPLDSATDPLLAQWTTPITSVPAPIRLRQSVKPGGLRTGFHKLLLLSLSAQSP